VSIPRRHSDRRLQHHLWRRLANLEL